MNQEDTTEKTWRERLFREVLKPMSPIFLMLGGVAVIAFVIVLYMIGILALD